MNPIRSGGSPIGVRQPPILDIKKIKNIIICRFLLRQEFILINGRTRSILAPVVQITLESNVPIASNPVLILGEPANSPSSVILPATQNRPNNSTINVR